MRVLVYNKQQYPVGRGGKIFQPREETEVDIRSRQQLAEIHACVYLKVTEMPDGTSADSEPAADVATLTLEQVLDSRTKAELIEEFPTLELTMREGKPTMIAKILAALDAEIAAHGVQIEGHWGDFPSFEELDLDGLQQQAEEWALEVPEDADKEALRELVQAEYDRRQLLEAPPIENADATPANTGTAA